MERSTHFNTIIVFAIVWVSKKEKKCVTEMEVDKVNK